MKIAGIYLAAGKSSRMGVNKLTLPVQENTLGSLALHTALQSSLNEIYVIARKADDLEWIPRSIKNNPKCTIIINDHNDDGQSASLRTGIKTAINSHCDAAVILLADQPFITVKMIDRLVNAWKTKPTYPFVATIFNKTISPPLLWSSSEFHKFLTLQGDQGAKAFLKSPLIEQGKFITCENEYCIKDIDTPLDYKELGCSKLNSKMKN